MSLRHWLQLSLTDGIGPILLRRLVEAAGSIHAACDATPKLLAQVDGIGRAKAEKIAAGLRAAAGEVDPELARAAAFGARIVCYTDDDYPVPLRSIPDPPAVLYVTGAFEPRDLHALAIVGSRRCSYYGREQAERFAALLAGAGLTVISGGARGIDSAAHRGAIAHGLGRTIAVLGSGVDVPYPPENASLFEQIKTGGRGAVVSEYPMGTPPRAENFPRRNRIVSGMSRGVLVVEADERSGALITARQACDDHGRPVFALPGRIDSPMSAGPHKLIRDGAVLTRSLDDILDELGPLPQDALDRTLFPTDREEDDRDGRISSATVTVPRGEANVPDDTDGDHGAPALAGVSAAPGLSDRQSALLATFDGTPLAVDALVERTGLPPHVVLQELTFLSLRGALRRVDGQTYARRAKGPA